jgi:hypothetical protein
MVTSYILILLVSAWLLSALVATLGARLLPRFTRRDAPPAETIALWVSLALLVVVSAPAWLLALTLAVHGLLHVKPLPALLPEPIAPYLVLSALLVLAITPFFAAPYWLALDAGIIAASLLGGWMRGIARPAMTTTWIPMLLLMAGLTLTAVRGGFLAS